MRSKELADLVGGRQWVQAREEYSARQRQGFGTNSITIPLLIS
jgi:hypothetical protein